MGKSEEDKTNTTIPQQINFTGKSEEDNDAF